MIVVWHQRPHRAVEEFTSQFVAVALLLRDGHQPFVRAPEQIGNLTVTSIINYVSHNVHPQQVIRYRSLRSLATDSDGIVPRRLFAWSLMNPSIPPSRCHWDICERKSAARLCVDFMGILSARSTLTRTSNRHSDSASQRTDLSTDSRHSSPIELEKLENELYIV